MCCYRHRAPNVVDPVHSFVGFSAQHLVVVESGVATKA